MRIREDLRYAQVVMADHNCHSRSDNHLRWGDCRAVHRLALVFGPGLRHYLRHAASHQNQDRAALRIPVLRHYLRQFVVRPQDRASALADGPGAAASGQAREIRAAPDRDCAVRGEYRGLGDGGAGSRDALGRMAQVFPRNAVPCHGPCFPQGYWFLCLSAAIPELLLPLAVLRAGGIDYRGGGPALRRRGPGRVRHPNSVCAQGQGAPRRAGGGDVLPQGMGLQAFDV